MKATKIVLLTGASKGLGLEIAKELMLENFFLVLTARPESMARFNEQKIFENDRLWIRPLDVTDSNARESLINEIERELGGVDVLINNAGFSFRSVVEHVTEADRLKQMETNYRAPMELARLVLPSMRRKRSGRIVNISSVGGMMAMPTMAVYSASKWALEGASESLWYEVRPWNVKVTLVQPGFINSDSFYGVRFTDKSQKSSLDRRDPYYQHYKHMTGFIAKLMSMSPNSSRRVAKTVISVVKDKNPPLRVAGTIDAHIFGLMRRFLPRRFYHWVLLHGLPGIRQWGKDKID